MEIKRYNMNTVFFEDTHALIYRSIQLYTRSYIQTT